MAAVDMRHMEYLNQVAMADVGVLRHKEATYMGSWKQRGGVGAFMMVARKWDRLESMLNGAANLDGVGWNYDVFRALESEERDRRLGGADGTVLAELRDLRRYLLLIECEMLARGALGDGVRAAATAEALRVPATDSNKHAERATPTPAMQEAALHTQDAGPVYVVAPGDLDGAGSLLRDSSRAPWRTVVKGDPDDAKSPRWQIVDRVLASDDAQLEHLMKLRKGLNDVEYRETVPPWFAHMYKWDNGRNEWALQPRYERWANTGHR